MNALVAAARRYLGVRFVHRGRRPDKLDCVGLIWLAYRDCGVELSCPTDYGREPQSERFLDAITAALGPHRFGPLQVGDVVTLRTKKHPHHVAFVGDYPGGLLSLIHASGEHPAPGAKNGRVVEQRLDDSYRNRIVTIHRRPI